MSNLTSTLTLKLVDDGLAAKAKADADALKKLSASGADLKKLGGSSKPVADLTKRLDGLAKQGERLDALKVGARHVRNMGVASRKARADVAATAKALAELGDGADPRKLARATKAHEQALKRQAKAHEDFATAVRAQRTARSDALGGQGGSIAAAEARIAAEAHRANAALKEQLALLGRVQAKAAAERGLAKGMSTSGRQAQAELQAARARAQAGRRIAEGMGAQTRAERAHAEAHAKTQAERHAAEEAARKGARAAGLPYDTLRGAEAALASAGRDANGVLVKQAAAMGTATDRTKAHVKATRQLVQGMGEAGRLEAVAAAKRADVQAAEQRLKRGMGGGGMPLVVPGGRPHEEEARPRRPRRGEGEAEEGRPKPRQRPHERREGGHGALTAGGLLGTHELLKLGAGFTAYEAVKEAYGAQAKQRHEEVRQRASGMSAAEVQEGKDSAGDLSTKYRAFSQTEIMHSLRNARSIVGSWHEAQEIMDPMLQLRTVALGAHPEKRQELEADFDKLIKGMEIKGVTQDLGKFKQYMDGMAKALNVFGDTLRPTDYYEMFKYGRQSTQGLSQDYMNTVAPTIAQELGGASGGVAHAAFFRAIVGGKMANNATEALKDIGLLNDDDLIKTKTGAVKGIKPGHRVKGADEAQANPYQWVQDYLMPALQQHELTSPERMQETIGHIFSNQVAAQLVSLFATQQSRIEKDKGLVAGAGGLSEAKRFQQQDPYVAWQSVKAQAENLFAAVGGFNKAAVALNTTSEALAGATRLIEQGPGRAETALAEHEAARHAGQDVMLAPSNIARLNDLFGDPDGNTTPEMAQARQEKLDRDAIDARRADLDKQKADRQGALDRLQNGPWYERAARRSIGQTPEGLQADIDRITGQRASLDAAVKARDDALNRLDEAQMAKQAMDSLRIRKPHTGQAMNPVGAWGLHGAAGMDQLPQFGAAPPAAPAAPAAVATPTPSQRPPNLAGAVPQQLHDIKDVLGGGGSDLSPTVTPKLDTSQLEGVKPKADDAKAAVEAVGGVTARPTVDTSSIAAATVQAQVLLSVLQSIPGAAGAAVAAAGRAAGTLRARSQGGASFSDGVTPGAGAE